MIIDCISDLHGELPKLDGGDLLIVAGDFLGGPTYEAFLAFDEWLCKQDYEKKVVIAGNHDLMKFGWIKDRTASYLFDNSTEFRGLKIYGSPWSLWFYGINPRCKNYTGSEYELKKHFKNIPTDVDILVTHTPPFGKFDQVRSESVGSISLMIRLFWQHFPNLKLHVFGHIHEHGGNSLVEGNTTFVNASIMNEDYQPVNKPVRIVLDD